MIESGGGAKAKTGVGAGSVADSSVPHRTDIRPGSRLRTKANRTEALPKSGHSGLHSSRRTGTWDRASARFGREATSGTTIPRMLQATSGLASDARDFEFAFPPLLLPDPAPSRPLRPRAHTHACARCPRAPGHTWPAAGAGGGRQEALRQRAPWPSPAFPGSVPPRTGQAPCTHCLFRLHPLSFAGSGSSPSALGRPACQVLPAVICQHVPPVPIPTFLCPGPSLTALQPLALPF